MVGGKYNTANLGIHLVWHTLYSRCQSPDQGDMYILRYRQLGRFLGQYHRRWRDMQMHRYWRFVLWSRTLVDTLGSIVPPVWQALLLPGKTMVLHIGRWSNQEHMGGNIHLPAQHSSVQVDRLETRTIQQSSLVQEWLGHTQDNIHPLGWRVSLQLYKQARDKRQQSSLECWEHTVDSIHLPAWTVPLLLDKAVVHSPQWGSNQGHIWGSIGLLVLWLSFQAHKQLADIKHLHSQLLESELQKCDARIRIQYHDYDYSSLTCSLRGCIYNQGCID